MYYQSVLVLSKNFFCCKLCTLGNTNIFFYELRYVHQKNNFSISPKLHPLWIQYLFQEVLFVDAVKVSVSKPEYRYLCLHHLTEPAPRTLRIFRKQIRFLSTRSHNTILFRLFGPFVMAKLRANTNFFSRFFLTSFYLSFIL